MRPRQPLKPGDATEMAGLTHTGKVRSHNEDCVIVMNELGLALVADGMGGYNAGEVAAGLAAGMISQGLEAAWPIAGVQPLDGRDERAGAERLIRREIAEADAAIFAKAHSAEQWAGMGTTLVLALFFDNSVTVAHIGDSRLYRLRGEALEQLTHDHSLLQEQIDAGIMTREHARTSNNRNVVTRALGAGPAEETEIHTYPTSAGDVYLLCSDGLTDMLDDEAIRLKLTAPEANLELAAQRLVAAANEAGGRDNISVILARVKGESRSSTHRDRVEKISAVFGT
jgi:PPM family protein phosphatase